MSTALQRGSWFFRSGEAQAQEPRRDTETPSLRLPFQNLFLLGRQANRQSVILRRFSRGLGPPSCRHGLFVPTSGVRVKNLDAGAVCTYSRTVVRLSTEKQTRVVAALTEGCSVRATERLTEQRNDLEPLRSRWRGLPPSHGRHAPQSLGQHHRTG